MAATRDSRSFHVVEYRTSPPDGLDVSRDCLRQPPAVPTPLELHSASSSSLASLPPATAKLCVSANISQCIATRRPSTD
jgi:hypothetical protein